MFSRLRNSEGFYPAALFLENGRIFEGLGFGAQTPMGGEVVFNTGMTGYQEVFSDPSYSHQVVVMGGSQMGNTGINSKDIEDTKLSLKGIVVREYQHLPSSWRSEKSLHEYLKENGIPGICEIDTREITKVIREEGAQRGVVFAVRPGEDISQLGKKYLSGVPSMDGLELVSQLSCKEPYEFVDPQIPRLNTTNTFVVYDFGVKRNILREIQKRGFKVQVVPYDTSAEKAMSYKPMAILLTNGPGDPKEVPGTVQQIQKLIGQIPILGICMGHQILGRSLGLNTYKLKFGHHGVNHPVKDLLNDKIMITSHNHGFAVEMPKNPPEDLILSHVNLNDQTVEGMYSKKLRVLSVQFHPEAAPGPHDACNIFDDFIREFIL